VAGRLVKAVVVSRRKYPTSAGLLRRFLIRTCLLGGLLASAACSAPVSPPPPRPAVARLTVANVSDYPWRLSLHPATGEGDRTERLEPRSSHSLEVASGDYEIEQTLLDGRSGPELTRHLSFHLEAGQSYRWQLTTLLSDNPGETP